MWDSAVRPLTKRGIPGRSKRGAGRNGSAISVSRPAGIAKTAEEGIRIVRELKDEADKCRRVECSLSELILGLECGGQTRRRGSRRMSSWARCPTGLWIRAERRSSAKRSRPSARKKFSGHAERLRKSVRQFMTVYVIRKRRLRLSARISEKVIRHPEI